MAFTIITALARKQAGGAACASHRTPSYFMYIYLCIHSYTGCRDDFHRSLTAPQCILLENTLPSALPCFPAAIRFHRPVPSGKITLVHPSPISARRLLASLLALILSRRRRCIGDKNYIRGFSFSLFVYNRNIIHWLLSASLVISLIKKLHLYTCEDWMYFNIFGLPAREEIDVERIF